MKTMDVSSYRDATVSISPELVIWAYHIFLDREPENEYVVLEKASRLRNIQDLIQEFLHSEEFRFKHELQNLDHFTPTPWENQPRLEIECVTSENELQELLKHIQQTWEYLGKTEPHWSVLTADEFRQSNIHGAKEKFYAKGREEVSELFVSLERNEIEHVSLRSCLEYGCGVGRVTRWLAERFNVVYGYDISQSHLQIAKEHLDSERIKNVQWCHVQKVADIIHLPKVDLLYSVIVLQHNPPPIIGLIIRSFIKALNHGGVAFFQVPTYRVGYAFCLKNYLSIEPQEPQMEMHALSQRKIFEIIREEGGRVMEVLENRWTGSAKDLSNTFIVQKA